MANAPSSHAFSPGAWNDLVARDQPRRISERAPSIEIEGLSAFYGERRAIGDLTLTIPANTVTAVIGPSGCGKSTFVRCLNRMHETVPGARAEGVVRVDGQDIYAPGTTAATIRQRIGMVFQRPNPFPSMSIFDNAVAGLKLAGVRDRALLRTVAESALRRAALWDEVSAKLDAPAGALSGGQQQRLCIARTIAVEPEIVLFDEPASALDPISTLKIEELMQDLAASFTIVVVTHNMQQAARVSDQTAFMLADDERTGRLVEYGPTEQMFTAPSDRRTEDYITGRFG
jgi:phosphate transport system ATP-binding protein